MANDKTTGRLKRAALRVLGPTRARKLLAVAVQKLTADAPSFAFPLNPSAVKKVLIILPPEKLQVLHQLRNIAELTAFFKLAEVTLLVDTASTPLAGLIDGVHIEEYPLESKKLFSTTFNEFQIQFKDAFDVCCLLTRSEDLVLLNLAGRTAARVRIGYTGAGGEPFLNIHVNPSADRLLVSDWNCAMAEMLGAKKIKNSKWAIAKQTAGEIDHLLKDHHLGSPDGLAGIDLLFFRRTFGTAWADECMNALLPYVKDRVYLHAEETRNKSEIAWLEHFGLPVLINLSIPQIAGLVARSDLIIAGNSFLFGLAAHLAAGTIGVFDGDEVAANFPMQLPAVKSVVYERSPGNETIEQIIAAMSELSNIS
jgi:ADP-heptose:LPS heptosyltransferase